MYNASNPDEFIAAAYRPYSGEKLPLHVICEKYDLDCLMSASKTNLPTSVDSTYYLCTDRLMHEAFYLYESDLRCNGGGIFDLPPKELTQAEAVQWVLSHTSVERLIEVLNGSPSSSGDLVDFEAVEGDDCLPF